MAVRPLGSTTASGGPVGANTLTIVAPAAVQAGDALVLVATCVSASNGTIATPDGWVARHTITAPHARVMLTREATGDTNDNVTLTADVTGAFCATMVAYRGIAPDAWQGATSIDTSSPFTSGAHEPADGVLVCAFSMQNNSGMHGLPTEWVGLDGNLRAFTWGGMTSSYGATNGIIDKLNATGVVTVEVDTTGVGERGNTVQWLELWNTEVLPELPGRGRIRSHVSEDAGSLFQATQALAVENAVSIAFPYGTGLDSGLVPFREALTPGETALAYYPIPTWNQEMLVTVEGETNLGRLAHTIAPRIFTRGTSIPGNVGGVVTAQQAIQHVVNRWSSEHPWLVFEPIPDLRLLVPEAVSDPRQYYLDNPTAGVLTTSNVVIEQEGNDRRTMREVLDEWLQIFPGTIVRQTRRGTIELVPRVGPDAPDGAALTLTWRDLARMSEGENDPRGIYNRARVTSQGWDWSEDTPLLPPSYIFSADGNGLRRSVLESEEVMSSAREEAWPNSIISFAVLNDGNPVAVDLLITAFGSWSRTAASSFSVEGSAPHQFTLARGQRRDVSITHWTRAVSVTSRWRFERLAAPGPDVLYVTPLHVVPGAYNPFGSTYLAYLLEFDVTGMAWTKSNEQITSEFGQASDHVPAEGGGNALDQSRSLYGERTATINSTVFQLDSTQARQVAESFVLHNINPRTIRDVQQSEWNRYPVKFDHIGRYVELPNGEVAVVENRSYSDSFAPRASAMMSSFTATVSHSVIDTTTEYLFNSDGSYWENDDGTISEVL